VSTNIYIQNGIQTCDPRMLPLHSTTTGNGLKFNEKSVINRKGAVTYMMKRLVSARALEFT